MSGLNETKKVRRRYDRNARFYDLMESGMEFGLFRRMRKDTAANLYGNVLEVGIGTGKNLPYYPAGTNLTAIDISPQMMKRAIKKAARLGLDVNFQLMDAQELSFPDNSFDFVITAFVFCSVPDPLKGLREIKRVLKPGGILIMNEHVLSKYKSIALLENFLNPLVRRIAGANINRDTRKNIENAGLLILQDEKLAFFDVFRRFTSTKYD
jgi:ubiquinone/menaquinone biosynthesis C-methylase UbiE